MSRSLINITARGALGLASLVWAGVAAAQGAAAASFKVGEWDATPAFTTTLLYDDNLTQVQNNQIESWGLILEPSLLLQGYRDKQRYTVSYKGAIGEYEATEGDDYSDHQVLGIVDLAFSARSNLSLQAQYNKGHDARGSTDNVVSTKADRWHSWGASGVYRFGAPSATGNLELAAGYVGKEYDNNRATTTALDKSETSGRATFFYRVAPKTRLLAEAQLKDIDYDLSTSTQDNTVTKYLAGATWEATGRTTGVAKVGYAEKDFDSSTREDWDGVAWEVQAIWEPRTYSILTLSTSVEPQDSTGQGDTIINTNHAARWQHNWNERTSSKVDLSYANADYEGDPREDDTWSTGIRFDYAMRRWLTLGAGYAYTDNDSNLDVNDYTRNIFSLYLTATL